MKVKEHKKVILKFTGIILLLLIIVFVIPNSIEIFSLNKGKFLNGEYWRIFTYPFTHFNLAHLTENLIGLALVAFIAYELKIKSPEYISTYFASAILAILPLWALISFITAGSSAAIYALMGFVSFDAKKFKLKTRYILIVLILIIFSKTIYSGIIGMDNTNIVQDLAHFSGLVFGVILYGGIWSFKKHKQKRANYALRGIK